MKQQLDRETFATLFEHARPALRVVAGSECGFAHADDAVQRGAMIALKKLSSFTPGTDFNAWTAAIVRGAARNTRRSESRHAKRARASTLQQTDSSTPKSHIEIHDERLLAALETLTSDQRCCLLLKTTQDKSYKQISVMLEIPEATARSNVFRARSALLDHMQSSKGDDL